MLLAMAGAAQADDGLGALAAVVRDACDCAAGQATGLDAALRCTRGPQDFGRLKVTHRDAWDAGGRQRAANLERIIETCIANAMTDGDARDLLGLAPPPASGPAPLARWRRVVPDSLPDHSTRLVRIQRNAGDTLKGLVEFVDGGALVLRRARRDGGGRQRIPVGEIRGVWVMEFREP